MKHAFIASQNSKSTCASCNRGALDHTNCAKCEACDKTGSCDLIEGMLLCASCETAHLQAHASAAKTADEAIAEARKLDATITYNGDFFNAKVAALVDVKRDIDNDTTLTEQSKAVKYQQYLLEKYQASKTVVFELDKQKHDEVLGQIAITQTLRELGASISKEVADKIKELDQNYTPIRSKAVITRVPKKDLSPFERIVQQTATSFGITLEAARQMLIDKGFTMAKKD